MHIALYNQTSSQQFEGLLQRSSDIALISEAIPENFEGIVAEKLLDDPMLLAVPLDHPLAWVNVVTGPDLGAQKWVGSIDEGDAFNNLEFKKACARAGFAPDIVAQAPKPVAALGLVAAGVGITPLQNSLRHQAPEGVVLKDLPWFTYRTSLWVAWHETVLRPLVTHFRDILLEKTACSLMSLEPKKRSSRTDR